MINVYSKEELLNILDNETETSVFFYAPMCGTCQLARTFIEVAEEAMEDNRVIQIDLNLLRQYAQEWEIQSVPCLIHFHLGNPVKKKYAMESVSKVYEFLKKT